jgi:riboflavin kinase/FMN adenylyltransferase
VSPTDAQSQPAVVTPGNHDGVHLGHRALLSAARAHAASHGLRVRALTFDPHPAAVLAPDRAPTPLTTLARRRELLLRAGAEEVQVQAFDHAFAALRPEAFLEQLWESGARAVVVGPDFRFGKGRAGDLALLRRWGAERGMDVLIEEPVEVDGERVSSSVIRSTLAEGDVARASRLLGRLHDLDATVIHGDQRGRKVGFRTANLETPTVLVPADGVYAVVARLIPQDDADIQNDTSGTLLRGIANLGERPTFDDAGRSLEVHLFDFDADLYGQRLRVGFAARIRGERRFDGIDSLRRQIEVDCAAARDTLDDLDATSWAWI